MSDIDSNMITKKCKQCSEEKLITEYHRDKTRKDGYKAQCKKCILSNVDHNKGAEYSRKYRLSNIEKISEAKKLYRKENIDRQSSYNKIWHIDNPEKGLLYARNRRARKRSSISSHTASDIRQILSLQKSKCAVCKTKLSSGYHVDHVIALANGGSNDKYNLQILCQPCNNSKHAKDPIYFMQSRGFLL